MATTPTRGYNDDVARCFCGADAVVAIIRNATPDLGALNEPLCDRHYVQWQRTPRIDKHEWLNHIHGLGVNTNA